MELLERDGHLAQLHLRFDEAQRGVGQIVFLGGEAGTGKSSVIWRFADDLGDRAHIVIGSCDGLSTPQPLGPLIDIAEGLKSDIARQIISGVPRSQIFHATLEDMTAAAPAVVVIEDAHWADEATRDLIRFLGRRWRSIPALLIVTFRCDETGPGHPLRAVMGELTSMSCVSRISLPPFSFEVVAGLATGRNVDPDGLYRLTRGNPFFVTEVLAADEPGIPQSIRDAVISRAARLPESARNALDAAAVLGVPGSLDVLVQVSGVAASAIDTCRDGGLLVEAGSQLRFQHELAREAIHSAIGPARRAGLHRRALEVMASGAAGATPPDRLVYHAAEAGDRAAVVHFGVIAGEHAAALGAHRQAVAQYERVLRFAGDQPEADQLEWLERHGFEAYLIGDWPAAIASARSAIALCRTLGDQRRAGENESRLARGYWNAGQGVEARAALGRALAILDTGELDHPLARTLSFQTELALLPGYGNDAAALGARALDIAEAVGDAASRLHIMTSLGANLLIRNDAAGRALIEESIRQATSQDDDGAIIRGWVFLACLAVHRFEFEHADASLTPGIAFARENDLERAVQYLQSLRALMNLHRGNWPEVEAVARELISESTGSAIEQAVSLAVLGRLLARQGDSGARDLLDRAVGLAAQSDNIFHLMPANIGAAEAAWLAGDRNRAIAAARRELPRALEAGNPWWVGELTLILWFAGESGLPVERCSPPFRRQMAGDWAGAAAEWQERNCTYQAAVAQVDGDEAALCTALATFEALGAEPMIEETVRRLHDQGVRSITRTRPDPVSSELANRITPREREVLTLLADGLSDRDIAFNLYIGPGTVRTHLTSLFGKLEVKSRTAAIAAARRGGLL